MIAELALICLTANVYFESRGEPIQGQIAVAHVTMTRVEKNQSSVCEEVLAPKQFSWTNDIASISGSIDRLAWKRAYNVASLVYNKHIEDPTNGATHFHAVSWEGKPLTPRWIKDEQKMVKLTTIGNHRFYVEQGYGKMVGQMWPEVEQHLNLKLDNSFHFPKRLQKEEPVEEIEEKIESWKFLLGLAFLAALVMFLRKPKIMAVTIVLIILVLMFNRKDDGILTFEKDCQASGGFMSFVNGDAKCSRIRSGGMLEL